MTILEDLWYGNINPHEMFLDNNRPFKHLLSLMGNNRDKLTDTFTDQQNALPHRASGIPIRFLTRRSINDGKCINPTNNRRIEVKRGFGSAFSCKFTELYEKSLDYLPISCYATIVNQFAQVVRRK